MPVVADFDSSPFTDTVAGLYNGIVKGSTTETDTQANAGLFSATLTKDTGAFTGKLILDGTTTSVAGIFNDETKQFTSPTLTNGFVTRLTLDIANARITGSITKMRRGSPLAVIDIGAGKTYSKTDLPAVALTGAHNVAFTAPVAPLTLPADEYPHGSGYGVLTLSNTDGAVKFAGVLADGTAFTSSSVLWQDQPGSRLCRLRQRYRIAGRQRHGGHCSRDHGCDWHRPALVPPRQQRPVLSMGL